MPVPNRVRNRMTSGLNRLIPILQQQKTRDISEADTVTFVKDVLSDVYSDDKYAKFLKSGNNIFIAQGHLTSGRQYLNLSLADLVTWKKSVNVNTR